MLLLDVGLFAALAVADKAYDWSLIDLEWWAWLVLASPALILMALLLVLPIAEISPGRLRNGSIALLGLLVVADVFARRHPLERTAERLPLRVVHQRDRGQPDGHDAADPAGEGPHGRRVADLLHGRDPRRRPRRERAGYLTESITKAGPDLPRSRCGGNQRRRQGRRTYRPD